MEERETYEGKGGGDNMSREYDLRLYSEYDISRHRYRELKEFCLQHEEKKSKLNQIYTLSSAPPKTSVMGGITSKPTENKAILAQQLKADITLVEGCLKEACSEDVGLLEFLKKNIIYGKGYNTLGYVPCGMRQFYRLRKKFFFILDLRKKEKMG